MQNFCACESIRSCGGLKSRVAATKRWWGFEQTKLYRKKETSMNSNACEFHGSLHQVAVLLFPWCSYGHSCLAADPKKVVSR
jgi:hypothetical protein